MLLLIFVLAAALLAAVIILVRCREGKVSGGTASFNKENDEANVTLTT